MNQRVFVTGLGAVSNLGSGCTGLWQGLLQGRSLMQALPAHWRAHARFRTGVWSPMPEPDWTALGLSRPEYRQLDPLARIAVAAAEEALADAGVTRSDRDPASGQFHLADIDSRRAGCYLGTGGGGTTTILDSYHHHALARLQQASGDAATGLQALLDGQPVPRRVDPFTAPKYMPNAAAAAVGIRYGLHGRNRTVCASCASGTMAIGQAYEAIRDGQLDLVLAGGGDYSGDQLGGVLLGFDLLGALAHGDRPVEQLNRPFDREATGFVFAQAGCAMLVLESEASLERRGLAPYAEIIGYAESFDAYSPLAPKPDGAEVATMLRAACGSRGCDCVDYVNPHATGTAANDQLELKLIGEVFRDDVYVNTTKSHLGHTLGAAGAIEALVCVKSLQEQRTHGSLNLEDPLRPARYVHRTQSVSIAHALSQSFGFGGHNAALLFAAAGSARG